MRLVEIFCCQLHLHYLSLPISQKNYSEHNHPSATGHWFPYYETAELNRFCLWDLRFNWFMLRHSQLKLAPNVCVKTYCHWHLHLSQHHSTDHYIVYVCQSHNHCFSRWKQFICNTTCITLAAAASCVTTLQFLLLLSTRTLFRPLIKPSFRSDSLCSLQIKYISTVNPLFHVLEHWKHFKRSPRLLEYSCSKSYRSSVKALTFFILKFVLKRKYLNYLNRKLNI